ncbi:response regulator transcription factor [Cryobacterium glaciale]|uniref:Response regulator transcription factor n=1 Tax=Cryobacterium glaciale TaxID=1259145 RepID=A0A4R8V3J9_9MICO|nr:response regulator [Cryobacterium glaciale]TFB77233.1 response regulator transcription factor [Cryobacterium glaciale]
MFPDNAPRRVAVIIEDDPDIRNLLEAVLSQAGFEAIATSNGLDGIAAIRAYDPIVTTLDVSMPGIDGFETSRRIRAFSSTYLVILTARGDEIDTLQGLEAGADDYLTKPFRPRVLRARIEAMLRRPRHPVPADADPEPAAPAPLDAPAALAAAAPAQLVSPPVEASPADAQAATIAATHIPPINTTPSPVFRPTPVADAPIFVASVGAERTGLNNG